VASPLWTLLSALAALGVVLGLIWLVTRAARWSGLAARPAGARRLTVVDALAIDARRRLTLVRCDQRCVLLLTGGPQDIVVGWTPPEDSA
jgi:flagellar protein FliO/FliZ